MLPPAELRTWISTGRDFQLVDIREENEVADSHMGGYHIPMDEVIARIDEIRRDIPVVIHCKSGKRSSAVVHALEKKFGLDNLYTLEGGIVAYLGE